MARILKPDFTAKFQAMHKPSHFDEKHLLGLAKDLQTGRVPLERTTISDKNGVTGLRAVIYKSGLITLSVSYHFGGKRPFMDLGEFDPKSPNHISIEDARELAKTVIGLAERGINVQDGLHKRLIRELKEYKLDWEPTGWERKSSRRSK